MTRTLEYRMARIERSFLALAALMTGEAKAAELESGEVEAMQLQLAEDMKAMADEL